jgi:lipopolysaccharide transport system ATP-binding protein
LAVGDASFQKKCLGKMQDVSKGDGRTVIFVSHNMNAIESLCNKAILLNKGEIEANSDDVRGVIKQYYSNSDLGMKPNKWVNDNEKLLENPWIIPMEISLTDKDGKLLKMPITNDIESYLEVKVNVVDNVPNLCLGYSVFAEGSENIYFSSIIDTPEKDWAHLDKGVNVLRTKIPARFLNEGDYKVELNTFIHMKRWILEPGRSNALVYLTIKGGLSDSDQWINKRAGLLAPVFKWDRIS